MKVKLASRISRLSANIIDLVPILLLSFGALFYGVFLIASGSELTIIDVAQSLGWYFWLIIGATIFPFYGINIYLLIISGQTIGKKLLKIKIVEHASNQKVGFVKIIILREFVGKSLASFLNLIPIVGGLISGIYSLVDTLFIFRGNRRCIHDLIADTYVVSIGKDGEIINENIQED